MLVENWQIDRVKPYPNNPRRNAKAVDAVADSIREFGFRQPIVVDEQGTVIVGHTRLLAAIKLGLDKVPVHVMAGLPEAKIRAYRVADNRSADFAEWDNAKLIQELDAMDKTGLDNMDFSGLLEELATELLDAVPDDNKPIDEDEMQETEHECPKCGFKW